MPDVELASIDLAAGLKLKKVYLPPTKVDVILKNPPTDLMKAFKKDDLVIQSVMDAAFGSLKSAKKEFQSAMLELDGKFEKTPLTSESDLAKRAETLQVTYKQIAIAQGEAAAKAAETAWDVQVRKKKDLKAFRVKFLANTVLGTLSIAASVTSAVLSLGVLAVTIVSAAKTLLQMAKQTYNYFRELAKTEQEIIEADLVIQDTWKKKSSTGRIVGRDLADALGVPFVKSVAGLRKLLDEYNAKSAKAAGEAQDMWDKAKSMMAAIEKLPDNAKEDKAKLGKAADKLLDQISEVMKATKDQDLFYNGYKSRLKKYDKMECDLGYSQHGPAAELFVKLGGLAATVEAVVKIAEKLA